MEPENDTFVPSAPPPPPPLSLDTLENLGDNENQQDEMLTASALQKIVLVHKPPPAKEERERPLNALELAVKRRAMKRSLQGDPEFEAQVKAVEKRVDEIKFERELDDQIAIIREAKALEATLETRGGPPLMKQLDWPTYDVAALDSLLKRESALHGLWGQCGKCVKEERSEAAESLLNQLDGFCAEALAYLERSNVERYQLRIDLDLHRQHRQHFVVALLTMLFESGFRRRDQLKTTRSKFGATYNANKAKAQLESACSMCKRLTVVLKECADDVQDKMKHLMARALQEEVTTLPRSGKSASSSEADPKDAQSLLYAYAAANNCKALSEVLQQDEVSVSAQNEDGNTVLHVAGLEAINCLLEQTEVIQKASELLVKENRDGDTPLNALAKRAASLKRDPLFLDTFIRLAAMGPDALLRGDSFQKTPLRTLSLKLSQKVGGSSSAAMMNATAGGGTSMFERYLMSETLSDVAFEVEGRVVPAHRIVLSAQSPTLRAMLEESQFKHLDVIPLEDVTHESLVFVFKYLYGGCKNVSIQLEQEAVGIAALKVADAWLIYDLVRLLVGLLHTMVAVENCFMLVQELETISCCAEQVKACQRKAALMCCQKYDLLMEYDDEEMSNLRSALSVLMRE